MIAQAKVLNHFIIPSMQQESILYIWLHNLLVLHYVCAFEVVHGWLVLVVS
jgi:hypothetical protein